MTRDELIERMRSTARPKPRSVEVPGWGTVHLRRPLTGEVDMRGQDETVARMMEELAIRRENVMSIRGIAQLICDEEGKRLFDPDSIDDVRLIADQPWELLLPVIVNEEAPAGN